jgi:intracellular septation protein A
VKRAREAWRDNQRTLNPEHLIFLDETGVSTNMARLRGRCAGGERLIGKVIPEDHKVEPSTWRALSLVSAVFHALLGAANIWIAYNLSEAAWVIFKAWIMLPVWLGFQVALIFWLLRGYEQKETPGEPS